VRVALVVGILVIHNLLTNLWFTDRWSYVPVNLATAGGLVAVSGVDVPAGAWWPGVAAAAVVLGAIAVVAVVAPRWLADRRMAGVDARGTAWRALVRIPLGTVVLEEVAFRAVLPALMSPAIAAALFGLWHVAPTTRTLEVNGVRRWRAGAVAGAVAVTAVVGLVLWELRVVAGGLAAPALVHMAANSGATVAAYLVLRRD
jgi:membrane protease YdiL (CAAX protease family)